MPGSVRIDRRNGCSDRDDRRCREPRTQHLEACPYFVGLGTGLRLVEEALVPVDGVGGVLEPVVAAPDIVVERRRGPEHTRGGELDDRLPVLAVLVQRGAGSEVTARRLRVGIVVRASRCREQEAQDGDATRQGSKAIVSLRQGATTSYKFDAWPGSSISFGAATTRCTAG